MNKKIMYLIFFLFAMLIVANSFSQTYITLQVNQAASLQADAGAATTICINDSTQIGGNPAAWDGTPPYSFAWIPASSLSNSTIANPKAAPNVTTTFQLTVTDAKGCTFFDTVTVFVNPCTSVNETANVLNYNIFPNPNNGIFTISFDNSSIEKNANIEVLNILGSLVHKEVFDVYNNQKSINLSHLNKGIYLIRIHNNGFSTYQKVMVN